jgi:nicotinamide-nucleotide amidase
MEIELRQIALCVARHLQSKNLILVCAESCTGGWVAKIMTDLPGSSAWFERGFVTYSNASKIEMLGVKESTLETQGAVSEQTVREMVDGALHRSQGNIALSISGIAGPEGGSHDKPVGTVWFAWSGMHRGTITLRKRFDGERDAVRRQAVVTALEGLTVYE